MSFDALKESLKQRTDEIDTYLDHLVALDKQLIDPIIDGTDDPDSYFVGHEELVRILKGAVYILLYNLIEAYTRRGFSEMFSLIRTEQITPLKLNQKFAKQWFRQRIRRNIKIYDGSLSKYIENALEALNDIRREKISDLYSDQLPFSGNLNQKIILEVLTDFGIRAPRNANRSSQDPLNEIKNQRNNLAHGDKSFSEVGRDIVVGDLINLKDQVVSFIDLVLACIQEACEKKIYLSSDSE